MSERLTPLQRRLRRALQVVHAALPPCVRALIRGRWRWRTVPWLWDDNVRRRYAQFLALGVIEFSEVEGEFLRPSELEALAAHELAHVVLHCISGKFFVHDESLVDALAISWGFDVAGLRASARARRRVQT